MGAPSCTARSCRRRSREGRARALLPGADNPAQRRGVWTGGVNGGPRFNTETQRHREDQTPSEARGLLFTSHCGGERRGAGLSRLSPSAVDWRKAAPTIAKTLAGGTSVPHRRSPPVRWHGGIRSTGATPPSRHQGIEKRRPQRTWGGGRRSFWMRARMRIREGPLRGGHRSPPASGTGGQANATPRGSVTPGHPGLGVAIS